MSATASANYMSPRASSNREKASASPCGIHGLSTESLSHQFEPFYTTKPAGMGMGLSICRSIIEAHDGRLWAIQIEPQGALFRLLTRSHRNEAVSLVGTRCTR
jgi:K+-sensing histidine kinase KdpD